MWWLWGQQFSSHSSVLWVLAASCFLFTLCIHSLEISQRLGLSLNTYLGVLFLWYFFLPHGSLSPVGGSDCQGSYLILARKTTGFLWPFWPSCMPHFNFSFSQVKVTINFNWLYAGHLLSVIISKIWLLVFSLQCLQLVFYLFYIVQKFIDNICRRISLLDSHFSIPEVKIPHGGFNLHFPHD